MTASEREDRPDHAGRPDGGALLPHGGGRPEGAAPWDHAAPGAGPAAHGDPADGSAGGPSDDPLIPGSSLSGASLPGTPALALPDAGGGTHTLEPGGRPDHPEVLLERLVSRTAGARHALLLSRDGLKLWLSPGLSTDQADQLAAIASGIQALAHGASVEFGDATGGVRQSMTEFHGGILFIVGAGEGAHLAVVGEESADPGLVGRRMNEAVEHIRDFLRADPRTGGRGVRGKLPA